MRSTPPGPSLRSSSVRITAALGALLSAAAADPRSRSPVASTVVLNGAPASVRWVDGDTFRILNGPYRGHSARLEGYNTLETYGPVHRWGAWAPSELYALARAAAPVAASREWTCTTSGQEDRYRRVLVSCPEAAAELVRRGLAMVYAVDGRAAPELVDLQRDAQRRGAGMWAKGVPRGILTSVHSAAEEGGGYNRVVDTRTGLTHTRPHATAYATCQEVCVDTEGDRSCMVYVPFERRYRHRPRCLRE